VRKERGFYYLLHSLNPERIIVSAGAHRQSHRTHCDAPPRMRKERVVFGRAIGQNQSIQHPAGRDLVLDRGGVADDMKAATLYDRKQPCAVRTPMQQSSSAGRVAFDSAHAGGSHATAAWDTRRSNRSSACSASRILHALTPITEQLILSFHRREGTRDAEVLLKRSPNSEARSRNQVHTRACHPRASGWTARPSAEPLMPGQSRPLRGLGQGRTLVLQLGRKNRSR
jgi:hypothetical protein